MGKSLINIDENVSNGSKRHIPQAVERSQQFSQTAVQIESTRPASSNGDPIFPFSGKPALLLIKAGNVETNPGHIAQ